MRLSRDKQQKSVKFSIFSSEIFLFYPMNICVQ